MAYWASYVDWEQTGFIEEWESFVLSDLGITDLKFEMRKLGDDRYWYDYSSFFGDGANKLEIEIVPATLGQTLGTGTNLLLYAADGVTFDLDMMASDGYNGNINVRSLMSDEQLADPKNSAYQVQLNQDRFLARMPIIRQEANS